MLGNSSDAFLMLRAQTVGFSTIEIFLVVAFSLVVALTSTKGGILSDTLGRRGLIVAGWLIYAVIYLGFAFATESWHIWILYAGYGLYYGAFLGASSAVVADLVSERLRGTAYGIFNAAFGHRGLAGERHRRTFVGLVRPGCAVPVRSRPRGSGDIWFDADSAAPVRREAGGCVDTPPISGTGLFCTASIKTNLHLLHSCQSLSDSAIDGGKKRFDFFQAVDDLDNDSGDRSINVESSRCEPGYERQTLLGRVELLLQPVPVPWLSVQSIRKEPYLRVCRSRR